MWAVVGTIAGLVVGAVLQYAFQYLSHARERREAVGDRLRTERFSAYEDLLRSAHACAHLLAAATDNRYGPPADAETRTNAAFFFDEEFVPDFRVVELIASDDSLRVARAMFGTLVEFRDFVTIGDRRVTYRSPEYNEIYEPFRQARDAFIRVARAELAMADQAQARRRTEDS